jgi:hypothetical protein
VVMKKNKFIGIAIWIVTVIGPFREWIVSDFQPGFYYIVMFLLSLVGVGLGGYFFSKSEKSNNRVA